MGYNEAFLKQMKANSIGLDDTFFFGCEEGCHAKCCFNDLNMIFQPFDIFRIARHFGQPMESTIKDNLVLYFGEDSKLPICGMRHRTNDKSCRFLREGKCVLHGTDAKPWSCVQFPLGRYLDISSQEYTYFTQPQRCGCSKPQIVREWLGNDNLRAEVDKASIAFARAVTDLTMYCQSITEKGKLGRVQMTIFMAIYINYDTSQDYCEQLEENISGLVRVLPGFKRS